jgi:hypothetical protein
MSPLAHIVKGNPEAMSLATGAERLIGTDWPSVLGLHLSIADALRRSS